jgi:uncharacterized protein YcbK (DUF882 family)
VVAEPIFVLLAQWALFTLPVDRPAVDARAGAVFDVVEARGEHLSPGEPRDVSKKEEWAREKSLRPDVHVTEADLARAQLSGRALARAAAKVKAKSKSKANGDATAQKAVRGDIDARPGVRTEPVTTLYNVWTREALPVMPGQSRYLEGRFHSFLRDHYTNQATRMDTRLIDVLARVAGKFAAARIDVVSGYRSPKYNLMLRKKGHQVARDSQHTHGNAVDFRIKGVAIPKILHYVRSLRVGGVGFYPHSQFVHSDTARIRYWKGS